MGTSGYGSGIVWYQSIGPKGKGGGDLRCGYRNQFKGNIRCDEAVAAKSKSKGLTSSSERTLLTHLLTIEAGLITTITIGGHPLPTP